MFSKLKVERIENMSKSTAQRLIELREKYNYSQTDVAKLLGVSSALISAYEKLERNPSLEKLIGLADIYHTSTDYLLGRKTFNTSNTLLDVEGLTPHQIQLLRDLIETMKN